MPFTRVASDTFARQNSSTVGNNWTDVAGGIWSINSGKLVGTTNDGTGYTTKFLIRPQSEAAQDQKVKVVLTANSIDNLMNIGLVLRYQTASKNHYLINVFTDNGTANFFLYKVVAATPTQILPHVTAFSNLDRTHSYQVEAVAIGINNTTVSVIVTDLTTNTIAVTASFSDNEATLQNSTGVSGLSVWLQSGTTPAAVRYSLVETYKGFNVTTIKNGWIGDSITAGGNNGQSDNPVAASAITMNIMGYLVSSNLNRGVAGSGTNNWIQGQANYTGAVAAFSGAGTQYVIVTLGTNDARTPSAAGAVPLTLAQHFANMQSLVLGLTALGYKVIINRPIYTVPLSAFSGVVWPIDVNSVYLNYFNFDRSLTNNNQKTILGDQFGSSQIVSTDLFDGVHPTTVGGAKVGVLWGRALARAIETFSIFQVNELVGISFRPEQVRLLASGNYTIADLMGVGMHPDLARSIAGREYSAASLVSRSILEPGKATVLKNIVG